MSEWTGHEEWMRDAEAVASQAYGGTAAARRNVQCECGHNSGHHEGDEYGFCLVCDCNHYQPECGDPDCQGDCPAAHRCYPD